MFVPRIKASEISPGLEVENISGMYSSDNPGGYGGPNITASQVTAAKLYVTPVTDSLPESAPIDVFSTMSENEGVAQILPWDIVSSWKVIESQKYKIRFVITATDDDGISRDYETYVYFVATSAAKCCIDKLTGKTSNVPFSSLFKDERSRKLARLSILMRRVKDAIDCGNLDSAEEMVSQIRENCNCCQ